MKTAMKMWIGIAALWMWSGCEPETSGGTQDDTGMSDLQTDVGTPPDSDRDVAVLPAFRTCMGGRTEAGITPSGDFDHFSSETIALSDPGHSIDDQIIVWPASGTPQVEGKFAYGDLSLDLEDEIIHAAVYDCSGWVSMGQGLTNDDGRVRFDIPAAILAEPGRYEVLMVVDGDGSDIRGYLLVTPAGTQFVVFDIDGTLTTSDGELAEQYIFDLFGGRVVPEAYDDAQKIVQAYVDAGYEVFYMTGRPYFLSGITRGWVETQGFPLGNLHLTASLSESAPTEGGVGDYKRDYLLDVMAHHSVVHAYGNAATDVYAYDAAGMPKDSTFIIGAEAGADGTQAVTSYTEHLQSVVIPPANQPFSR